MDKRSREEASSKCSKRARLNLHPCPLCSETFSVKDKLIEHFEIHNEDYSQLSSPSFPCPFCPEIFASYHSLSEHFSAHENDFSQPPTSAKQCFLCETVCPNSSELESHFQINHQDFLDPSETVTLSGADVIKAYKDRKCPMCGMTFKTHMNLQEHIYSIHPEFYDCAQAGYGTKSTPNDISMKLSLTSLNMTSKYIADFERFEFGEDVDETTFFKAVQRSSLNILENEVVRFKNFRVFFSIKCQFSKSRQDGTV